MSREPFPARYPAALAARSGPGFRASALSGKVLAWALAVVLGSLALLAQSDALTWEGHKVHPTRILAKLADPAQAEGPALATVAASGSRIERRYALVPGLVLLDDPAPRAPASLARPDEEAQRQRLWNRIQALKATGLFEYVEPDYLYRPLLTPSDAAFVDGRLWGLQNWGQNSGLPGMDIAAPQAWDLTTGSTNVIVGVIDTGVRYTHWDLEPQMWVNPNEVPNNGLDDDNNGYVDDVHGIDATQGTGDPMDTDGHGTHVAGTIGAAANDSNPHVGVAWQVRIMAARFIGDAGFGSTADAITSIDYTVQHGARILNNSWGGGPFSMALFDAISRARDRGVLFVAAAGNESNDNDENPAYPASYALDNILSVAAIDRTGQLADFSNYGDTSVHLGAPGVEIFSSYSGFDNNYQFLDGTSMAAPHVSGVAALVWSLYPEADLEEVRDRILAGAVPTASLSRTTITGGRLNAYNALTVTGEGLLQISVDPPSGSVLLNGSQQPVVVRVRDRFGVRDATVQGRVQGGGDLIFLNNGQPPDEAAGDARYSAFLPVPGSGDFLELTLEVSAPGRQGLTNTLRYTLAPRPLNDAFATPTKVPAGGSRYQSNNRFATIEAGEPAHGGFTNRAASLWWTWTAPVSTNVLVDATGTAFESVLAVYTGNVLTNLQPVTTTTNVSGRRAYLFFNAQADRTYAMVLAGVRSNALGSVRLRIAPGGRLQTEPPQVVITSPRSGLRVTDPLVTVTGTATDTGPNATEVTEVLVSVNNDIAVPANGTATWSRSLRLQPGANRIRVRALNAAGLFSEPQTLDLHFLTVRPPNDDFAQAALLTGNTGSATGTNSLATAQPGEPQHAGQPGGRSLWWRWQAPADGSLLLSTEGSTFDTLLGLYTGELVNTLTPVAANDDAFESSGFSKLQHAVRAQTVYSIAVDGFAGANGRVELAYSFTPGQVFSLKVDHTAGGSTVPPAGRVDVLAQSAAQLKALPQPDYEFAHWEGDVNTVENPVSVVVSRDLQVRAVFRPLPVADDFETGNLTRLPWVTEGAAGWFVTDQAAAAGRYSVRSGALGNSQTSTLRLIHALRAGKASFDFKVSSESGWDFLEFWLDDRLVQKWSGEQDWTRYEFTVTAGPHTLEWRYVKDAAKSAGQDAAWLDNVVLPLVVPDDGTVPRLSIAPALGGGVQVKLRGQTNQLYVLQAADSLPPRWRAVHTNVATGGEVIFLDPESVSAPQRFYRGVRP